MSAEQPLTGFPLCYKQPSAFHDRESLGRHARTSNTVAYFTPELSITFHSLIKTDSTMPTGSCLCGEVRIEYTGEPVVTVLHASLAHC